MRKYLKGIFSMFIIGGLLVGCGTAKETSSSGEKQEEPKQADQKPLKKEDEVSEPKKDENENVELLEVGQTTTSEAGTAELLKIKKVNETVDIAPLKVTVQDIKVIKLSDVDPTFAEELSYMADTEVSKIKDGFSYIQVQFTAENTSEENVDWYNIMNVITDKGEQIDGQMKDFFADDAEMDSVFIGKVNKEYQDGFIINDAEINKVKLVFGYSINAETYENITEEQTVEYTFD